LSNQSKMLLVTTYPLKEQNEMEIKDRTILLTGATGFIGRNLCAQLLSLGANLIILTRSPEAARKIFNSGNVEFIKNLSDVTYDRNIDIIINLAGEPIAQRWTARAKQKIFDSRVKLTQNLLNFVSKMDKKPALIVGGSAIGVYGTHAEMNFSEASRTDSNKDYFSCALCYAWESAVKPAMDMKIRTVILRTGIVLEKDGGIVRKMLPSFKLGLGGRLGSGNQYMSWIHRKDLIGLIIHAITDDRVSGPLNGTAPEPVTNKQFTELLAKAINRPALIPMPAFLLKLIFGRMAKEIMLEGQKVFPVSALNAGYVFLYPTLNIAFKDIDL
jgi:uncharacterized protein (TIGR01777 family)